MRQKCKTYSIILYPLYEINIFMPPCCKKIYNIIHRSQRESTISMHNNEMLASLSMTEIRIIHIKCLSVSVVVCCTVGLTVSHDTLCTMSKGFQNSAIAWIKFNCKYVDNVNTDLGNFFLDWDEIKMLTSFNSTCALYLGCILWKYDFLKMHFSCSFSLEGHLLWSDIP